MLASDYPLLDILWTLGLLFALLGWIWLVVKVVADIIRKWRFGGPVVKALWIILVIAFPLFGVWAYLLVRVLVDDLLPRNDLGDGAKVLWILSFVFLWLVGVGIYLLSQRTGMTERGTRLAKIRGDRRTGPGTRPAVAPKTSPNPVAYRECPHCKESMRRDASVCPHCRRGSPAWEFEDGYWWVGRDEGWDMLDDATGEWKRWMRDAGGTWLTTDSKGRVEYELDEDQSAASS